VGSYGFHLPDDAEESLFEVLAVASFAEFVRRQLAQEVTVPQQ
jgi:hypothetical protein